MIIDEDAYLEHYGVLGMRWGVRKEQERQAFRESRAQKFDAKSRKLGAQSALFQTKISELQQQTPRTFIGRHGIKNQIEELSKIKSGIDKRKARAEEDAKAKREGKLGPTAKRRLIGAGIVAGIVATTAAALAVESGEVHRFSTKGKAFLDGKSAPSWPNKPILSTPDLTPDAIMHAVVKPINPEYGKFGTKMNCRRATYAYEMRRRGNDVRATRSAVGRGQDATGLYNALSPNKKIVDPGPFGAASEIVREIFRDKKPFTDFAGEHGAFGKNQIHVPEGKALTDTIFDALAKNPNGARGELGVKWRVGGGHSMAWEVIKGKAVIFDCQTGKKYSSVGELNELGLNMAQASFTRLDNLELNQDFLLRWLKDAS